MFVSHSAVGDLAYAGSYGQHDLKTRFFYPLQQPHTQTKDYRHQKQHGHIRKKYPNRQISTVKRILSPKARDLPSYKSRSSRKREGFPKPLEKRPEDVDQRFLLILVSIIIFLFSGVFCGVISGVLVQCFDEKT